MSEGVAEPADLRPAPSGERRRPVWVVPDGIPAVLPRSARFTEARWVAKYRQASLAADLGAGMIGASLALVARFGAQINPGYLDRKSTRLNSSHGRTSDAGLCLDKNT